MQYEFLPKILQQEGTNFHRIERRWKPQNLIPDPYRRNLLKDAQERFNLLSVAEDELRTLDKASLYIKILRRMRLDIRAAQFAWRFNDLEFLASIANFFTDYGTVLRHLKDDEARGRIKNEPESKE